MTVPADSRQTASIRDVARLASVSHQTVSRVLNGHPNVRPSTRQKVLDAAAQLNFRPNRAARALATSRSDTIGVLMTASPAYYGPGSTMISIEDAARASGYSVLLASPRDIGHTEFGAAFEHLMKQDVDGIIIVAPQAQAALESMQLYKPVPTVMVRRDGDDLGLSVDNEMGGMLAAQHLWELGHRRTLIVTGPDGWSEAAARRKGFERVLARHDARPVAVEGGDWSAASGYAAFRRAADLGFTAAFCGNDQMALGLIHAAVERGLRVPEDISVVGFDDIPEAAHFWPPLTTVHQDFDVVGRRAVDRLLALLGHPDRDGADHDPLCPRLVVRHSTAVAPAGRDAAKKKTSR